MKISVYFKRNNVSVFGLVKVNTNQHITLIGDIFFYRNMFIKPCHKSLMKGGRGNNGLDV